MKLGEAFIEIGAKLGGMHRGLADARQSLGASLPGMKSLVGSSSVALFQPLLALRAGVVGESEPMRRFGVLLSEAAVKAEAARLGIARVGAELTEGQKVQARSSLIIAGMADASGDLVRTQDSVANRLREIKG